ncbi:MAG: SSU ribosomal protein S16p, partial [uncultured Acidimicrobiales bacterium]
VRQAPPHANGQDQAADLSRRRCRQPFAERRPVHRDRGHVRASRRALGDQHRQRQGAPVARRGCPAHRAGREAAQGVRRLGRVPGHQARQEGRRSARSQV